MAEPTLAISSQSVGLGIAGRLLSERLLSDQLAEGPSQFGFTCAEFEIAHR